MIQKITFWVGTELGSALFSAVHLLGVSRNWDTKHRLVSRMRRMPKVLSVGHVIDLARSSDENPGTMAPAASARPTSLPWLAYQAP